ncbi:hypothetical protein E2C01_037229 [Portunus trituberculatus]|uniref:Uncharacterized protein n=1 Tax=Portunus trituberculatus TaxID=210409 RepID=A0A5B7FEF0_PORTR|nr:hypothetical protein [Portunus trituberculatus]
MSSPKNYAQLRSNSILTSLQSSPPTTPCIEGNNSCRMATNFVKRRFVFFFFFFFTV